MKYACIGVLLTLGLLSGCSNQPSQAAKSNQIKLKAVADAAREYGAQGGLAWESHQLNQLTKQQAPMLDAVFRFDELMLAHHVIPPVLVESGDSLNLDTPNTIRLAAHTYRIQTPARFATASVRWQDYLVMKFNPPKKPHNVLMPHTQEEMKIWMKNLLLGWNLGIDQAKNIFQNNLAHLSQDFVGMELYHSLLAQHIVTPPYVATTQLGITGNKTGLRINDRILRIAEVSKMNPHSDTWRPAVLKGPRKHARQ